VLLSCSVPFVLLWALLFDSQYQACWLEAQKGPEQAAGGEWTSAAASLKAVATGANGHLHLEPRNGHCTGLDRMAGQEGACDGLRHLRKVGGKVDDSHCSASSTSRWR